MSKFFPVLVAACLTAGSAGAAVLKNGDFDRGSFGGWNIGLTATGDNTVSVILPFDVTGTGVSRAAAFRPGTDTVGVSGGVTLSQSLMIDSAGTYGFGFDVASLDDSNHDNLDGGTIELLIGGSVLDSFDFGYMTVGVTERARLYGTTDLVAGAHDFTIRLTRQFTQSEESPMIYVDNAAVYAPAVVPLPASMPLLLAALGGAFFLRRRKSA